MAYEKTHLKRPPVRRALVLLTLEALWPRLWPGLGLLGAGLAASLLLPVAAAPTPVHIAFLLLIFSGAGVLLWRGLKGYAAPTRREALARLEEDGDAAHHPLLALDDAPLDAADEDSALWRAHMARMQEAAGKARLGKPKAAIDGADPFRLRYALALALVCGFALAGREAPDRIAAALQPGLAAGTAEGARIDLWLTPPDYTGTAPLYLARSGAAVDDAPLVRAPEGTRLSARISGVRHEPRLLLDGLEAREEFSFERTGADGFALDADIGEGGVLRLSGSAGRRSWPIEIIPDAAPAHRLH